MIMGMVVAAMLSACGGKGKPTDVVADSAQVENADSTELIIDSVRYAKTSEYSDVQLFVAYPKGADSVSLTIRCQLCDDLSKVKQSVDEVMESNGYKMKTYHGDATQPLSMTSFFGQQLTNSLLTMSRADYAERVKGAEEYAKEHGEAYEKPEPMAYEVQYAVREESSADRYLVMARTLYLFFGGAHGSSEVSYLTFNKQTGALFTAFLKPDMVNELQPILRRGLVSYFSAEDKRVTEKNLDDQLMLNSSIIPLPACALCPTPKGLLFHYGQYEVACYAAGMPSFVVPYKDIRPYLTDEAIQLLGL